MNNLNLRNYYIAGIIMIIISSTVQAQNLPSALRSSIDDDKKQRWLKKVTPSSPNITSPIYKKISAQKVYQNNDLTGLGKIYGNGIDLEAFDNKYQVNPLAITYNSDIPVNQLPAGYVIPMFIGGRFVWANPNMRVDQLVYPSGMDLSGGGRKKMSAKAKAILQHVFNMEVEEW